MVCFRLVVYSYMHTFELEFTKNMKLEINFYKKSPVSVWTKNKF